MILLFGDKAKANSAGKSSKTRNNPVENSGILAHNNGVRNSLLTASEYDMYMFSQQAEINYEAYSQMAYTGVDSGFMSAFASAISTLGESGYSDGSSSFGGDCSCSFSSGASFSSGGSFSSVC